MIANFQSKIDRCKRGSKQWWHLVKRKWKRVNRIDNQTKDALHKHTNTFVQLCQIHNVGTVAIGDLTGIRNDIDYGKRANQKLHQWAFAKLTDMIVDKCKAVGIKVKKWTSHIPRKHAHLVANGISHLTVTTNASVDSSTIEMVWVQCNIRKKYQGCLGTPVEAAMAPPVGIRLETQCCSA